MKFTYEDTPYEVVEPSKWTTLEAIQLQQFSGLRPSELWLDFIRAGALGVHAVVWITLRRNEVNVDWADLKILHFDVVEQVNREALDEPPDPSPASTRRPSAKKASPRSTAPSRKNSGSTNA